MSEQTAPPAPLSHEDVELYFDEYTDSVLSPALHAKVAAHLAECSACAGLYRDLAATADALGSLKTHAPSTMGASIEASIHTRSAGRFFARRNEGAWRQWFFAGPGLIIALVLLLAVLVYFYWLSASPTGTLTTPPSAPASQLAPAERITPN